MSKDSSLEHSVLVIVPTYNEVENLRSIVGRVLSSVPRAHVLVMDDNSPDGTGALADSMSAADNRVHVVHRAGKQGLGAAYIAGFAWGLEQGYSVLVQIDADGSHPPETLPEMLAVLEADPSLALVVGSRWVRGGRVVDWPKRREALSRSANVYANIMLGVGVHDATAGFRAYRADYMSLIHPESVVSKGYCFQIDMTLRVFDSGGGIAEVPIVFRDREAGESKMSGEIVVEAMRMVTLWGIQRRLRSLGRLFRSRSYSRSAGVGD